MSRKFQRSFLKWAGGKYRVLDKLLPLLPPGKRFFEPFAGSCVVSLNTDYEEYCLNDLNGDLIVTLNHARGSYISDSDLNGLFIPSNNNKEIYNQLRYDFNNTSHCCLHARLFVYLNRHCFNGLWRCNSKGHFNVPFGKYKSVHNPKEEVRFFREKFAYNSDIYCRHFKYAMFEANRRDIVYCDPPYVPLSATANFTGYTSKGFGLSDHKLLVELAKKAALRGATVLISNHDIEVTRELYKEAVIIPFNVQRSISAKSTNRKKVKEIIAIYGD